MSDRVQPLNDREMLLLVVEQQRNLSAQFDRLSASIEQRLAQGDRRFAEQDTRIANLDQSYRTTSAATIANNQRMIELEKNLTTIRTDHEKAIGDLRVGHEKAMNALRAEYEKELNELRLEREKVTTEMRADLDTATKQMTALKEEFSTWKARIQTAISILGTLWALFQFALPYLQDRLWTGAP